MRALVLRSYTDGNNGRTFKRGSAVNVSPERFEILKEAGYITEIPEEIEDIKTSPSEKKGKKNLKLENLKK